MLYDDEDFIAEFCDAAIESFSEFSNSYEEHLLNRDEPPLRKAGHKIKPVAQMIGVEVIVDEYEHAKEMLHNDNPDKDLRKSVNKVKRITRELIEELDKLRIEEK